MSYVITLPKPTDRLLIYRFPFPPALFHVLLLTMRRICVTLLAHTFLTPTSCNMNLGLSSPPLPAKRAPLDNPVFRMAGRASSQTIRTSAGKSISFPHSLLIRTASLISRMSWMVNSMYVHTLFCRPNTFWTLSFSISGIRVGLLKWRRPLHNKYLASLHLALQIQPSPIHFWVFWLMLT